MTRPERECSLMKIHLHRRPVRALAALASAALGLAAALPDAPLSGHWFSAQFHQLVQNAYPPPS
jgi:cellulase/cellobiase CelA1